MGPFKARDGRPFDVPGGHPKWAQLGKTNLSDIGLAIKEGTTALVVGINVEVNYALGLVLDGRSLIGGEAIKLTIPRASLAPKKVVDFMSDKPIEIELEGEDAPFYVDRPVTV